MIRKIALGVAFTALAPGALGGISAQQAQARSEVIAVVVNEGVITRSDVEERMKLIVISSGLPNTPQTAAQLMPQVVSGLIDEKLKIQEAEKYELSVSPTEISEGFATIAEQNNMEPEQFRTAMERSGLNPDTLRSQIKSQIAWAKVVQARLRPQVIISDSDIEAWQQRLEESKGKNEYLVSEIFLPVESPQDEVTTRQLAQSLVRDIRAGKASFYKVAQQVSQAAGAAQGGDLGWVQEGQIAPELEETLKGMEANSLSDPVKTLGGIHVLLLRDKRMLSDESMPSVQDIRNMIGLKRLNRLQERFLMDLKSSAFIENRIEDEPS